MKTLYLIRHAKSSKDIPGIKDIDRPLNKRGERQVLYMGRRLKELGTALKAFYSSPAKRAFDTATVIAKKIGFPREKIKVVNSLYYSNIPKLMKVIKKIDDTVESAVIFGHNPEFLNFVNYLTPHTIREFPTCGIIGIDFAIDSWKMAARRKGKLAFLASPKKGF